MELFWITAIMVVAASGATVTVIKALRAQEKELSLLEPFDIATGGLEGTK